MKKSLFPISVLALAAALSLPACSRDTNTELRASSPSAAEFNRQVAQSTKTDEELAADSVAEAKRRRRTETERPR
jgi:hypothetical protein